MEVRRKKRKLNDEEPHRDEQPIPESPRPGRMREKRRSEIVQKIRTRVKLPKLYKKECLECGGLNIFFDRVTNIDCYNCQEAIVKKIIVLHQIKRDVRSTKTWSCFSMIWKYLKM